MGVTKVRNESRILKITPKLGREKFEKNLTVIFNILEFILTLAFMACAVGRDLGAVIDRLGPNVPAPGWACGASLNLVDTVNRGMGNIETYTDTYTTELTTDASQSQILITPLFCKMACKQNLDLRCVLVSAPWVLGPKHASIRPRL